MVRSLLARLEALDAGLKRLIANRYVCRLAAIDPSGLVEAFLYSWRLDLLLRYRAIRSALPPSTRAAPVSLLDVGGGSGKIAEFIEPSAHTIFVLDRRPNAIRSLPLGLRGVIGDMAHLPIRDGGVDVVVSADAIEHVPTRIRGACLDEMRRVASSRLVIHCPIEEGRAGFLGGKYDLRFGVAHRRLFGFEEHNVEEHIACGTPTLGQIRQALPDATLRGTQNAPIWCFCLLLGRIPFIGLLVGPFYWLFLSRLNRKPPFYSGLVVDTMGGKDR